MNPENDIENLWLFVGKVSIYLDKLQKIQEQNSIVIYRMRQLFDANQKIKELRKDFDKMEAALQKELTERDLAKRDLAKRDLTSSKTTTQALHTSEENLETSSESHLTMKTPRPLTLGGTSHLINNPTMHQNLPRRCEKCGLGLTGLHICRANSKHSSSPPINLHEDFDDRRVKDRRANKEENRNFTFGGEGGDI